MFGFNKDKALKAPPAPAKSYHGRLERAHVTASGLMYHSLSFLLEGERRVFRVVYSIPVDFPYYLTQAGDEVSFGVDSSGAIMHETFQNITLKARLTGTSA